nr:hypothetical protein BCU62_15820 [Enterovibrio norvegicus]
MKYLHHWWLCHIQMATIRVLIECHGSYKELTYRRIIDVWLALLAVILASGILGTIHGSNMIETAIDLSFVVILHRFWVQGRLVHSIRKNNLMIFSA